MTTLVKTPRTRTRVTTLADHAAKSIGARLRSLRRAQKVRLVELAKASGVDTATISRIETGKMSGTLESHIKLATALGYKLTELYAGIEEDKRSGVPLAAAWPSGLPVPLARQTGLDPARCGSASRRRRPCRELRWKNH